MEKFWILFFAGFVDGILINFLLDLVEVSAKHSFGAVSLELFPLSNLSLLMMFMMPELLMKLS